MTPKKSFKVFEIYSENLLKPYSRLFEQIGSFSRNFLHLRFHHSDFSACSDPSGCRVLRCVRLRQAGDIPRTGLGGLTWAGVWSVPSMTGGYILCDRCLMC